MGVGVGFYMCDVVKKSSRSLSHLLMSSCRAFLEVVVVSSVTRCNHRCKRSRNIHVFIRHATR